MAEQEFTGRSAAEAAIKACEALGLTRSELTYRVVSDEGEGAVRMVEAQFAGVRGRGSLHFHRDVTPLPVQLSAKHWRGRGAGRSAEREGGHERFQSAARAQDEGVKTGDGHDEAREVNSVTT